MTVGIKIDSRVTNNVPLKIVGLVEVREYVTVQAWNHVNPTPKRYAPSK